MDIDDRVARFTLKVVFPKILPEVAVMVVVPDAMVVARPLPSTVTTDESEEVQVTCVVISSVVPSEYVPKAVNWSVTSTGTLDSVEIADIETSVAGGSPELPFPPPPPPHPKNKRTNMIKITRRRIPTISFSLKTKTS